MPSHDPIDDQVELSSPIPRTFGWSAIGPPLAVGMTLLVLWEAVVRWYAIPPFKLPAPSVIAETIIHNRSALLAAWLVTVQTMLAALLAAVVSGVLLAALLTSSRRLELSLFPYAVVLQVTPLVAVAPFVMLWIGFERVRLTQIVCAWIVAFFPILSNSVIGLRSADHGLGELFTLYRAGRFQRFRLLLAPAALPYFLSGLKIAANLSLVGAVVAEFVVGIEVERPGLASTIFAAQQRSDAPLMFAALTIVSLTGVVVYFAVHLLSWRLLKNWHESAGGKER